MIYLSYLYLYIYICYILLIQFFCFQTTHWNSPNFYAFYPTGNSYPAVIGDLLCNSIGGIGLSWISSPVCTELEVIVMNWLGKSLALPDEFLNCNGSRGGGVIEVNNIITYIIKNLTFF